MSSRKLLASIGALVMLFVAASLTYAQGAQGAQRGPIAQSPAARVSAVQTPAPDADHDGLPDAWEVQYGLNPNSAAGPNGATGDSDRDGLVNGDEYANGTDPRKADTDGDGLPDLWEVEKLTNPLAAGGSPSGRKESNMDRFERDNDDFVPPKPHKHP